MEKLLSVRAVAECLSVQPMTIYHWCYTGRLAYVKLGRMVRIPETEVERLVTQGRRAAGPPPLAEASRRLRAINRHPRLTLKHTRS